MADQGGVRCTACATELHAEEQGEHYRSEWHRYNVKRRCAGLEPLGRQLYEAKLTLVRQQAEESARTFECGVCVKTFRNEGSYNTHVSSKKHLKKAANAKAHPRKPRAAEEAAVDEEEKAGAPPAAEQAKEAGEEDEEEAEEGDAVPLGTCLFSGRSFDNTDALLEHMLKRFGFYLPYVERLEDLEGLLEFLGEKVGVGHVCVHCHQRFRSLEAVRKHMVAKSHCSLRFENEEDFEEMEFFYNLEDDDATIEAAARAAAEAAARPDGAPPVSTALLRAEDAGDRGVSYLNKKDELVMKDGAVIGHRSHQKSYHHKRPEASRHLPPSLAAHLKQRYKAIGLPGYTNQREKGPVPRFITRRKNKAHQQLGVQKNNIQKRFFRDQVVF